MKRVLARPAATLKRMTGIPPQPRARPTMNDVAEAAGVSLKTVSRVVNGVDYVSSDKLQRVNAAIEALGFRRNEYARQLRQGTTATVGLVLEDVADPFYSTLTRAVEDVALGHNHMLLTSSSAEDPARSRELIMSLGARGVGGLIVTPAQGMDAAFLRAELASGCSLVFVDRPVAGVEADTVLVDNRGGAETGAAHLLAHGHTRVAFFGDDARVFTAGERLAGYRSALTAAGVPIDPELVLMAAPSGDDVARAIDRVLALPDPPTAILSGNNRWSVRLLRHLRGRHAASHLAIVGFDDFELSDVLSPGITVVAQDPAAMGHIAAELLFRRMSGDTAPVQRVQLATTLIERGSGEIRPR
jgi:LacI family transcriptional regulator